MEKKSTALKRLDTPVYGYWQALYLAFYSSLFYVDVGKRWRGFGFLYLLFMISLLSIPVSIRIMVYFHYYYDQQIIEPIKKIPTLFIMNGEVQLDKPMPVVIKNEQGKAQVIIDTTSPEKDWYASNPELSILVTKNKIQFRSPKSPFQYALNDDTRPDQIQSQAFDKNMNQAFNGQDWVNSSKIREIKWVSMALILPMLVAFILAIYLVFLPVLAFLGQIFSQALFSFKLKFKTSCRLLIVAATPMSFFVFLMLALNLKIPGSGFFALALLSIYFSYAILCLKRDSQKMALR